jgi:hypothetical protein
MAIPARAIAVTLIEIVVDANRMAKALSDTFWRADEWKVVGTSCKVGAGKTLMGVTDRG